MSRRRTRRGPRRPAAFLGLLALAATTLLLTVAGSRMALAGLAAFQAEAFLQQWRQQPGEPTPEAAAIAQAAAQRAIDRYPVAHGDYQHRLGLVLGWQHYQHPWDDPAAAPTRQAAAEAYRAAIAARPAWPATWAQLARTQLQQSQRDAEFTQTMDEALRQGPWRIDVTYPLAEIGLLAWPTLDVPQKTLTLKALQRAAAYSPGHAQRLYRLAQAQGLEQPFCLVLDQSLKTRRKLCQ